MRKKLNILVMNRQFHNVFGGVEYMSTTLLNEMSKRGHQCHLLSLDMPDAEIEYELAPSVVWHKVSTITSSTKASWKERYNRFKKIRQILISENIDVAIGFQDGAFLSLAISSLGSKTPVVAAERNAPTRFDHTSEGKFRELRYQSFRLAKSVAVQCPGYVDMYPFYLRQNMAVIPNPVFPAEVVGKKMADKGERKTLLSVGRLSYQKNFMVLLQAFEKIANDYPDWDLCIVGDGEDRTKLESFTKKNNLTGRVNFVGYVKDTTQYYRDADLFCLSSRWEGFPNALAEAMAHSISSLGFSNCAGVSDLIEDGVTGVLAPGNGDVLSLSKSLALLMGDDIKRQDMAKAAKLKTMEFTPSKIYDKWEDLFYKVQTS